MDGELYRKVAIKQIQSRYADNADSRAHFIQEAEITGGLEHPNIVPVYGLGTYAGGRPYYAMLLFAATVSKKPQRGFTIHHENSTAVNDRLNSEIIYAKRNTQNGCRMPRQG